MGRGGGGKGRGGGGGDKTGQFFQAIESQKVETVRWSLVHGGIMLTTCNDNGETGLMVAANLGRDKSMETMLEQVARMRMPSVRSECLNARDGEGRTPLMMAAASGRLECVKMLMEAGANLNLKDEAGYTARAWGEWAGKQDVLNALDGIKEESSEEEDAPESDGGFEGETATQRRKRKKRELSGAGPSSLSCAANRSKNKDGDAAAEEATPAAPVDTTKPVLQEIEDALKAIAEEEKTSGSVKEVKMSLVRTAEEQAPGLVAGALDPALWRCGPSIRHLEIRWRPGLDAGALDRIGSLKRILHLHVQDSGLPALPDALGELVELRSLEVDGNNLKTFPSSLSKLAGVLESLSAARCKLTSDCLTKLAPLDHLASLKLDHNKLDDLDDLALNQKPHLVHLSVANNKLTELPEDPWEKLIMLQHLNVSANKITELPCEMGAMKEKKLTELLLDDNPWKDGKIRNMIQDSAVLSNTVLVYLRKQKPKGNKKPKGKPKRKPKAESESEAESEEAPEPEKVEEPEPAPASTKKGKKKKGKAAAAAAADSDAEEEEAPAAAEKEADEGEEPEVVVTSKSKKKGKK